MPSFGLLLTGCTNMKTVSDNFRYVALAAFAVAVLAATSASAQVIFVDEFDDTNGVPEAPTGPNGTNDNPAAVGTIGDGIVDTTAWRAPFGGGPDFVGQTQFRFDVPSENVASGAPASGVGSADNKVAVLNLDTYNPLDPGNAFYGTDLVSKRNFALGGGISMTTRMRLDGATRSQAGIIGAAFLFDVSRDDPPGSANLVRDEIDHELPHQLRR